MRWSQWSDLYLISVLTTSPEPHLHIQRSFCTRTTWRRLWNIINSVTHSEYSWTCYLRSLHCHPPSPTHPTKLWEGNVLHVSVILFTMAHTPSPPPAMHACASSAIHTYPQPCMHIPQPCNLPVTHAPQPHTSPYSWQAVDTHPTGMLSCLRVRSH